MTGREFGEALERVVEARRVALRDNYNFADRPPALSDDCIGISLADLRAALASKDAGPSADDQKSAPSQEGAGSAGGLAVPQKVQNDAETLPKGVQWLPGGLVALSRSEFDRLRAWEKFGREAIRLARGNITGCGTCSSVREFFDFAKLPQDAGEPK